MRSALVLLSGLALILSATGLNYIPQEQLTSQKVSKQTIPTHLVVRNKVYTQFPKVVPQPVVFSKVFPPFLGTSFVGFKEALAFKESRGNYFSVNSLGYLGRYQFGESTLNTVGVYNPDFFLRNPQLQEVVFYTNLSRNKWILRRDIQRFAGSNINGIEITESGILAAAHLAGPGNVKRYLRSIGQSDVEDAYGTRLSEYLSKFSGYDVSVIPARKNPRI